MPLLALLVLLAAAACEVGGDAIIRMGLRSQQVATTALGMSVLALYGLLVNQLRSDFGRLLGVYVAVFALVSLLAGRLVFREQIAASTWMGIALIVAGGAVIQFGGR